MKLNIPLLKLIIRLIILLILFVVLFLISAFLYSARYWPDIYNYVNANITITRIPTLSELNLTIIEVEFVTETYSTTDFDYTDSTSRFDTNTEDYAFSFDDFDLPKSKTRRNAKLEDMGTDYSEVPKKTVLVDYFFIDEESRTQVIKDLVDESKLTTRGSKDVEIMSDFTGSRRLQEVNTAEDQQLISKVFPWVAAIFVKNESESSQFNYFCDGALLSERVILTAARCVHNGNATHKEENFIVILGKKSLQTSADEEKILRVKKVTTHENFALENGNAANDLAFLTLEEAVIFTDAVSPAVLENHETNDVDGESNVGIATAWSFLGDLTLIYFDKEKSKACRTDNKVENTFCATYGNDVPLCPSYGGLYISKQADKLYLHGIRTGDPLHRGICFSKQVTYTSLQNYTSWVNNVVLNKDA